MMNRIIKGAASAVAVWLMRNYEKTSIDLIKIRAVAAYVKAVAGARYAVMGVLGMLVLTAMLVLSFLMANIAFFCLLIKSEHGRMLAIFIASVVYFLICLIAVVAGTSEKLWMRVSRANRLVAQYSNHRHRR